MPIKSYWRITIGILALVALTYAKKSLKKNNPGVIQPLFLDASNMANIMSAHGISSKMSVYYLFALELVMQANIVQQVQSGELIPYNHFMYSTSPTYRYMVHSTYDEPQPPILDPLAPAMANIYEGNSERQVLNNVIEGDILVPDTVMMGTRKKRSLGAFGIAGNLWGSTIPYKFVTGYPTASQTKVRNAMDTIESKTCLTFATKLSSDVDYLSIGSLTGCSSSIGKHGGAQLLSLDNFCVDTEGIIIHELFHALGLHHTHSRLDRNSYVSVDTTKVDSTNLVHFDIHANQHADPFGIEYDYQSVMHYGKIDYSTDGVSTVINPNVSTASLGQRTGGSFLDYTQINLMYGCYDETPHSWPMDEINAVDEIIVGTTEITGPDNSHTNFKFGLDAGNTLNALRLQTTYAYADLGSHPGKCVVDPDECSNGFSALFWFKVVDATVTPQHLLSSHVYASPTATDRGFDIKYVKPVSGSQKVEVIYQLKDSCRAVFVLGTFTSWTHIAVTYSATNDLKIYKDGTASLFPAISCGSTTNVADSNSALIIGKAPDLSSSQDVDLLIDDVVIWEKEVDSTTVGDIKDSGAYHDMPTTEGSLGQRAVVIGTVSSYTAVH